MEILGLINASDVKQASDAIRVTQIIFSYNVQFSKVEFILFITSTYFQCYYKNIRAFTWWNNQNIR